MAQHKTGLYGQKAAFFDLDGTLACHNLPPHPEDVVAIREFRQRGHLAFLCTGRSTGFLYDDILDIGFDGIVAGAGAYIVMGDKLIFRRVVTPEQLHRIIPYFTAARQTCILEGERSMFLAFNAGDAVRPHPLISSADITDSWAAENPITKLTIYGQVDGAACRMLGREFSVIQHPTYAEIIPGGCSKGDGIRRILAVTGIEQRNTLAFGDSHNDLDMLQYAGLGVAMGNADETVRAAADYVTSPQNEAGVAKALYKFVLL